MVSSLCIALFTRIDAADDWHVVGHGQWSGLELLSLSIAVLALLALFGWIVVAHRRRLRYRAEGMLSATDRDALAERIAAAERRSRGEIVCVVLERSDPHPAATALAALCFVLIGSAVFAAVLPWGSPLLLWCCLVLLALIGAGLALWQPEIRRAFVPESRAAAVAEEQALQEFHRNGVHQTAGRTGVLLLVSLFERRVVVLGDEGITEKVGLEHWGTTDAAILEGVRAGDLRRGLENGIDRCAEVLVEHFASDDGGQDEVPNHLIVRRE